MKIHKLKALGTMSYRKLAFTYLIKKKRSRKHLFNLRI